MTEEETSIEPLDIMKLKITSIGEKGDGIGKVGKGFTIIVPESKKGRKYFIRIKKVFDTYAFGEIIKEIKTEVN